VWRKKNVALADEFIPIWFRFTPDWYRRLKALADESGVTMDTVIREGVKMYTKASRARKGMTSSPPELADNLASTSATELAKRRWRKLSPEERREQARNAAKKRWATKKGNNGGAA
jgi:hypothetical protein